ncbi:MAG: hypothetical protein QNJ63_00990 [Calothrix sp. MO_192.B10]|nr:hypothetical protein [Calothrix sp. MO_192.B10]
MVTERYKSWLGYAAGWCQYAYLRTILRTTARWSPLKDPAEGYTVIIGVPWQLWELIDIPLLSLQRANISSCREVILAVDTTEAQLQKKYGADGIARTLENYANLQPRLLYYNRWQQNVCGVLRWNWIDCWLTWVIGLSATKTRFALLHDFDAVVIDPEFCQKHFNLIAETDSAFVGVQIDKAFDSYQGAKIFRTIELMLDASLVRSQFAPVDLFNRPRMLGKARILCDILRDIQLRVPQQKRLFHKLKEDQIVHPSQVVSQWHQLRKAAGRFTPIGYCPLLVVPYFRHIKGDSTSLIRLTENLQAGNMVIEFEGSSLDLSRLNPVGREWIAKQIERLDIYFSGTVTDIVKIYCDQIRVHNSNSMVSLS